MSAAEKLRELYEKGSELGDPTDEYGDAAFNALPLIADVVEAAERIVNEKERVPVKHMTGVAGHPRYVHSVRSRVALERPLAALREHLEQQ